MSGGNDKTTADTLWLRGGFPDSLLAPSGARSLRWRQDLIRSYLERDIPQFAPRLSAETLRRLWTMLAHRQGGLLNVAEFARNLGVDVKTAGGYLDLLVNLLLVPYLLDGIRAVERGVASTQDIDTAMRLGAGHPMGPLTLADFVGLDTLARIGDIMFAEYAESRYATPPLLRRMVSAGMHGRKSGRGFYDYALEPPRPIALT